MSVSYKKRKTEHVADDAPESEPATQQDAEEEEPSAKSPRTEDFPIDYVFVPRRYGRWYISPNLRGIISTGDKAKYPDGWMQHVEMTEEDGQLSKDDMYGCNRGILYFKGKDYLPEPRKVHILTKEPHGQPDLEHLKITHTAFMSPERRDAEQAFVDSFSKKK